MHLLEREQAELARFIGRNEGFRADRLEIPCEILDTGDAVPAAAIGLDQLEAPFHAVGLEGGAHLLAFEFGMFVIGGGEADADLVDAVAAGLDLAAKVRATLLAAYADRHVAMALFLGDARPPGMLATASGGEALRPTQIPKNCGMEK